VGANLIDKIRTFTKEEFKELGLPYGKLVVEEKIVDADDRLMYFDLIFRLEDMPDNLAYKVFYSRNKNYEWNLEDGGKAYLVKYITHSVTISEWVNCDEEISG
jgi:proline dehydrogenase